jgi:hemolysin activation/secretion protein
VGVGLRLQAKRYASVSLDLGWPLKAEGQTTKGAARLHASGVIEF